MVHLNAFLRKLFTAPTRLLYALLTFVISILACSAATEPPATLQVRLPTTTPTALPALTPTPTLLAGVVAGRPTDASIGALLEQVQNDRMMFNLSTLVNMGTRHILSAKDSPTQGIGAARDWLFGQFNAIRDKYRHKQIDVWTQPVVFTWRRWSLVSENIVAIFQGSDVGAGVIVLGAHYDSVSNDPFDGKAPAPGANNNASGVAALLEIAQILAPLSHRATIIFVAFTAKESGGQGGRAFVESYLQAQDSPIDVRGMINLDTMGSERGPGTTTDKRTLRLFSAPPNESASRQFARQFALFVGTYVNDVNLVLQSTGERVGRWGDQQAFSEEGYASAHIIQGLEPRQAGLQDTTDAVQLDYLMRATRAVLAGVIILASGPPPPRNLVMHEGTTAGTHTLAWKPTLNAAGYLIALRQRTSLFYDQILTVSVPGQTQIDWDKFSNYSTVAVGSIDASGRMGPLSPEYSIDLLLGR